MQQLLQRSAYLESHSSLAASMDDFEVREFSPTLPELPSQHSGFRSNQQSTYSEASSRRRSDSPPVWRKAGSGWFKHQQALSPNQYGYASHEPSPQHFGEDDGDLTAYRTARGIPLPESPVKGRSPTNTPEPDSARGTPAARDRSTEADYPTTAPAPAAVTSPEPATSLAQGQQHDNYIRFSTSLDVMQRTEPIEAAVATLRKTFQHMTRSKYTTFIYAITSLILYWACIRLVSPPTNDPLPDLVKVAGLAKSFEPVIYYSESGHAQIEQLQETGVAVWDLGESIRTANMTSAPMIVNQLDDLSDSLKVLALELTKFFANVDADVDSILLVMEWAQRELSTVSSEPPSAISTVWSNTHGMLMRVGLISDSKIMQTLLGQTHQQRTKAVLERTFVEFLGVLEESINNELTYSVALVQLFEAIDKQFLNLQRTVIREQDQQERMENDFLGSLWTKVVGVNAYKLRKFEKNQELLRSVRDRTVRDKNLLLDHNQRLLQLKSNLEILRRKLVSPLVRASNSSTLSVTDQIRGLETTYLELKGGREAQRRKMMQLIFGVGQRNLALPSDSTARMIESRPH